MQAVTIMHAVCVHASWCICTLLPLFCHCCLMRVQEVVMEVVDHESAPFPKQRVH